MPLIPQQEPPYYTINDGPAPAGTKYYTALLTQVDVANPTITILLNTLDDTPDITRTAAGDYRTTTTFNRAKTTVLIGQTNNIYDGNLAYAYIADTSNILRISTIDTATTTEVDDVLDSTTLQIIVYP